ncbi:hypothetical protein YA0721_03545 [Pseudomonas carnis]|uniref:hypothetical protein n=1 Tax=Pseudomonas carnis TaxID=2487355 RepID=UPI0018E65344|nr:hypothetical protein [Pseudomonas carnis]MBI6655015.1 hypothetical protein [Pseudomonas carnis]MBI6660123.1 hypothetical protein [Pseudomonas carnis]MBI6687128.1 hypothetical protein [Pseudomonas carnis]
MTTNQTIDGVPRELLKRVASRLWADGNYRVSEELRAMLDAPAENAIEVSASDWVAIQEAASESTWMPPEYMRNDWVSDVCRFLRKGPAAQAQGEPVAWQRKSKNEDGRWFALPDSDVEEAIRLGYEVRKLYAEQPAPVAVVLPDPGTDQQVEARAKEIYEGWSYNPGFAPWVDGGNSIMQSKARDLARRELAPVAAAQTCCGSCPGGCTIGKQP